MNEKRVGKTEGPGNGRKLRRREKEREWVRGRRRDCGMGLEEGRVGRMNGSLIWLQVVVSR